MDDQRLLSKRLMVLSAVNGLLMGLVYHIMMRRLDESIRAAEQLRSVTARAWAPLVFFALVSAAFGWAYAWLVERVSGLCGPVQWIPLGISLVIAILVGVGLSALLAGPTPDSTWLMFLCASAGFAIAAGIRMKLAD